MGIFSKSCEYAMRAVFYIAMRSQEGKKVGVREIATQINSPEPFLAKILQKLSKQQLVQSSKGPTGGFYFDEAGMNQPLWNIVMAIEGAEFLTGCGMGLGDCSELNPCPLHFEFKEVKCKLTTMLQTTTVGKFNIELTNGSMHLVQSGLV